MAATSVALLETEELDLLLDAFDDAGSHFELFVLSRLQQWCLWWIDVPS